MICKCGCGKITNIDRNGVHREYFMNHSCKKTDVSIGTRKYGYNCMWIKTENGWKREHKIIVEKVLGYKLKSTQVIHHVDLNRDNNRNNNLVVCEDQNYHMLLHTRTKELRTRQWLESIKRSD